MQSIGADILRDPGAAPQQGLHLHPAPLALPTVALILGLVLAYNIVPYVEEFLRALRFRAGPGRRTGTGGSLAEQRGFRLEGSGRSDRI